MIAHFSTVTGCMIVPWFILVLPEDLVLLVVKSRQDLLVLLDVLVEIFESTMMFLVLAMIGIQRISLICWIILCPILAYFWKESPRASFTQVTCPHEGSNKVSMHTKSKTSWLRMTSGRKKYGVKMTKHSVIWREWTL